METVEWRDVTLPAPLRFVARSASLVNELNAGKDGPDVMMTIRGVVWSIDGQSGQVSVLVPSPEFGGFVSGSGIPWQASLQGEAWSFERESSVEDDAGCRVIVVPTKDLVGKPMLVTMDGDPLLEWWMALMGAAEERREEAKTWRQTHGEAGLNEFVEMLEDLKLEHRLVSTKAVLICNLVTATAPFDSASCLSSEDETVRKAVEEALFGTHKEAPQLPDEATKSESSNGQDKVSIKGKGGQGKKKKGTGKGKGKGKGKDQGNSKGKSSAKTTSVTEVEPRADEPEYGVLVHDDTAEGESGSKAYLTHVPLQKLSWRLAGNKGSKGNTVLPMYATVPRKYYTARYRLFSLFDRGIQMDQVSWYSVTPETIAEHIAERCRSGAVLDVFAGCGGNAIQFAFTCEFVVAIEQDAERIALARNNARVYGVEDRIEFIQGDAVAILAALAVQGCSTFDALFLSPPWGGPEYISAESYDLGAMQIPTRTASRGYIDGIELFHAAYKVCPNIAFFLPRNVVPMEALRQLQEAVPLQAVEIERHVVTEKVKTCCLYAGDLLASRTLGLTNDQ